MTTDYRGGYGIIAFGQSEYGNAQSTIEPRFLGSRPADRAFNVPVTEVVIKFTNFSYSSWVDISTVLVEVSEDAGLTYAPAFQTEAFVAPYNGAQSKWRRPEGHSMSFYIHKTAVWPIGTKVLVRFTGTDEFGQTSTKSSPVMW
jgi:hypothetical protein